MKQYTLTGRGQMVNAVAAAAKAATGDEKVVLTHKLFEMTKNLCFKYSNPIGFSEPEVYCIFDNALAHWTPGGAAFSTYLGVAIVNTGRDRTRYRKMSAAHLTIEEEAALVGTYRCKADVLEGTESDPLDNVADEDNAIEISESSLAIRQALAQSGLKQIEQEAILVVLTTGSLVKAAEAVGKSYRWATLAFNKMKINPVMRELASSL